MNRKVRIYYKPNNEVMLVIPIIKENMVWEDFWNIEDKKVNPNGYRFDDTEIYKLPDIREIEKWRGEKGKGIWIDESIITPKEKRQAKEKELDDELAKPNPDPVAVIRLNRELEKMK